MRGVMGVGAHLSISKIGMATGIEGSGQGCTEALGSHSSHELVRAFLISKWKIEVLADPLKSSGPKTSRKGAFSMSQVFITTLAGSLQALG